MVNELLQAFESSNGIVDIEKSLIQLLDKIKQIVSSSEPDALSEDELINTSLVTSLTDSLSKHKDERLKFLVLEIFAEIAKTDSGRLLCADAKIIKLILDSLSCQSSDPTSNVSFQACRVLGNTCFECDAARNIVKELDGEVLLMELLRDLCNNEGSHDHLRVACGAFLNTIADHETLQLSMLSLGALDVCCRIVKTFYQHSNLMKAILNIIELLFDNLEEINDSLSSDDFLECFLILLKQSNDQEIIDSVFQILSTASENDKSKLALSSTSFPEKLCELIEGRENESEVKFADLASDFIILLLTGDEGMDMLFQNGKGKVFLKLRSWLSTSKSVKLQTTAAFALCNIARSDKNCIFFVESGVVDDILAHLNHYPVHEKQPVLQHALIGTLTNLSITGENKLKMIEKGTIDKCLTYLDSESLTVIFKSLGAIRMLLDKNCKVACQLGNDNRFLSKLNDFSSHREHEGIRCESWRIVALIIKNARDSEIMKIIVEHNLAESLLKLLQSKHLVMKNEAILSLIILVSSLDEIPLENKETFCKELEAFLSSNDPLPGEVLSNVLVLILKCQRLGSINSILVASGIPEALERYKDHSDGGIQHLVNEILHSF